MATILGTANNDVLTGLPEDDLIKGLGGKDTLSGLGGNDIINGGDGNDTIFGGEGNDYLTGDNNHDTIHGDAGNDQVRGGDGNNSLWGDAGDDIVIGGTGVDTAFYAGSFFDYTLTITGTGAGSVRDNVVAGLNEGLDTFSTTEAITFSDYTVFLDGRNSPVLAFDDVGTASNQAPVTFAAADLLANDFDYNNDTLTITGVAAVSGGSVVLNGTNVVFTPGGGFSGVATFTYTVSDGQGSTDVGAMNVTVTNDDTTASTPALTVSAASGSEDSQIALSVSAAPTDTDGSETITLRIENIPVGATLSSGTNSFTATAGNTTADISSWGLATLRIRAPLNSDSDFSLTARAIATETNGGATAETTASLAVTVAAVADSPALSVSAGSGSAGTPIDVNITALLNDNDGSESLALHIDDIPVGAILSDGINSFTGASGATSANITGWTLADLNITPPAGPDTQYLLGVRAIATEANGGSTATTSKPLQINVGTTPPAGPFILFSGRDIANGRELFLYNGQSVSLIEDINLGTANSAPGEIGKAFAELNGFVYFSANDGATGYEVHRYEIAAGEVSLVADINPGSASSTPGETKGFFAFNGNLYFTATNVTIGRELFKIDGTTGQVTNFNLNAGVANSNAGLSGGFFEFNDDLYFSATVGSRDRLMKIEGTTGLTEFVDNANVNFTIVPNTRYAELNGDLYFTAKGKGFGVELHKVEGDTGLVSRLSDISAGAADSNVGETGFTVVNGDLYFLAQNTVAGTGKELYRMDGDTGQITGIDISPGADSSLPSDFFEFQDDLFFSARTIASGRELYRLDGDTGQLTHYDINPGAGNSNPGTFGGYVEFQGDLYFVANKSGLGAELHRIDGDTGVLSLVSDIRPGSGSAFDGSNIFNVVDDHLYFSAVENGSVLPSFYRTDGVTVTKLVGTDYAPQFSYVLDWDGLIV